ncbi:MAG: hypothetical protein V8S87_07560 [Oscillospiraceae bacterium]
MKLMILDGNSIVNRAFYGVRPLNAPDGTPTNAVYGFLAILQRMLDEQKPEAVCVSFDLKAPTFRHKACNFYKAQPTRCRRSSRYRCRCSRRRLTRWVYADTR